MRVAALPLPDFLHLRILLCGISNTHYGPWIITDVNVAPVRIVVCVCVCVSGCLELT